MELPYDTTTKRPVRVQLPGVDRVEEPRSTAAASRASSEVPICSEPARDQALSRFADAAQPGVAPGTAPISDTTGTMPGQPLPRAARARGKEEAEQKPVPAARTDGVNQAGNCESDGDRDPGSSLDAAPIACSGPTCRTCPLTPLVEHDPQDYSIRRSRSASCCERLGEAQSGSPSPPRARANSETQARHHSAPPFSKRRRCPAQALRPVRAHDGADLELDLLVSRERRVQQTHPGAEASLPARSISSRCAVPDAGTPRRLRTHDQSPPLSAPTGWRVRDLENVLGPVGLELRVRHGVPVGTVGVLANHPLAPVLLRAQWVALCLGVLDVKLFLSEAVTDH